MPTLENVFTKLGKPLPLGYSNVGRIIGIGEDVNRLQVGDRVVSNGPHAEYVNVPVNLTARDSIVSSREASFAVLGSISLQGIRLLRPSFGETILVFGLGLIGLILTKFLK